MAKIPKTTPLRSAPRVARRRMMNWSWNRINGLISFVLIVLLASPGGQGDAKPEYEPGKPLARAFYAPFDLQIIDQRQLEEELKQVESTQYFRVDQEVRSRGYDSLGKVVELARKAHDEMAEAKAPDELPAVKEFAALLEGLGYKAEQAREDAALLAKRGISEKVENELRGILSEFYDVRGTASNIVLASLRAHHANKTIEWTPTPSLPKPEYDPERIVEVPGHLSDQLRRVIPLRYSSDIRENQRMVEHLIGAIVEPVIVLDPETRQAKLEAVQKEPPRKIYQNNKVVFPEGTVIGPEEQEVLHQFQERRQLYRAITTLGIAAFVALLFTLVALYIKKFPGEMPNAPSSVILISLPTILAFVAWRILQQFGVPDLAGFGFPAALVGMLGVVLLGPRFAWLLVTCAGLLFGVASDFDFSYVLVALFGGFTAVTTLYTTRTRWDILTSAGIVSLVNAIVILAINFILEPAELSHSTARAVAYGVGNGLICGALVFPLLWLFERLFGVVTDFALLELTGTIHPLIRELEEKAPGSYQHTLNVTKLAEAAAREIGANYLLVRAGGYFHDIGKIEKPRYFSENQLTQEDRSLHAKLSPYMSTLIIKNHVKEGIELATKSRGRYKLPREVIAFIPEHQGTALITYFHRQALRQFQESESTDPVHEADFRYPGPKPQSIETAIVMLADGAEATVTSVFTSSNVNEDELRRVVRKSINDKFDDGQFDECDLTLRDLHLISESFVKTLLGRFHHRVVYPEAPKAAGAVGGVRRVGAPISPGKPEPVAGR